MRGDLLRAAAGQQLGEVLAVPDCLQATPRHRGPSVACEIGDRTRALILTNPDVVR
jgi:hypothetical protein